MSAVLELGVPEHVHHHPEPAGGALLLDSSAGVWFVLNRTGGELWQAWSSGMDFEQSVTQVAASHEDVPLDVVREDAKGLLSTLVKQKLVHVSVPPTAVGVEMVGARRGEPVRERRWQRALLVALAIPVLTFSAMLVRVSFPAALALVRATRRGRLLREPSVERATDIAAAVGRAARWYPGRAACLEQSLTCVLLAALLRHRLFWCLGSVPDPYRFHAWAEVDGRVVADPAASAGQSAFRATLMV